MFHTIAVTGNRVSFRNLHATLTTLPNSKVALTFDDEKQPPIIMSCRQIEAEFGKTLHLIPKGKVASPKGLNLSNADLEEVKRRAAYVNELQRLTKKGGIGGVKIRRQAIARAAREIQDPSPISHSTLARWARTAKTHSQGVAATLSAEKRHRKSSFSQDIQDFALETLDDYYLQLGNPTLQYAYDCFSEEFENRFGKTAKRPCREVYRKWAKQCVGPIEFIEKREGRRAARAASRNATRKIQGERILERVEADAVNLAIGVKNEDGRYLGPVTLFAVIDVYSRAILGLIVQVGRGESSGSVIDSYKHAISPKPRDALPEDVEHDWPMYGAPETFVSDGGPGYASLQTHSFLLDAGCQTETVKTYAGWRKPFIERFFLTLRTRFAQTLRGYCGKHTDRPNLDATIREKASMTLQEFRTALHEWVIDEYHQTVHSGLGRTPYEVWDENARMFTPQLPANFERIRFTMGETRVCKISGLHAHQGVQLNNLRYNDHENRLKHIGMKLQSRGEPAEVTVQYTHNDLSSVNVVDPFTDDIIQAFVTDTRIEQGTSLSEWNALRRSTYADKGFTGKRKAKSSRTVRNANEAHDENMRRVGSRRSQQDDTGTLNELINSAREGDDNSPIPTVGTHSMSTKPTKPSAQEYGADGEYEDD
ncbi:DDE-type integrase/transposase/recombinase [Marinobacter caseinilyticus]|uniref:DDE-type integrase/transposase/recombinase n=1 Tax=Marinobacter caseinilyticus TaxID=2692195 RepID=UPI00140A31E8|nr:DDE-type integrase/transposase/recombinase [Marinobacter caseinilyticus]